MTMRPVILCGGNGTRLWPRSRSDRPKPFLPLLGDRTLYERALDRCADEKLFSAPIVVAGAAHIEFARAQAREAAPQARFIQEPMGRNTAPAIALAALRATPDTVLFVMPSDHHIADTQAFNRAAAIAQDAAVDGHMVTFGITPDRPETGYGYILVGAADGAVRKVERFVEKPDAATAREFLADNRYVWNAGIFAFRADRFLAELARHRPDMERLARQAVENGNEDGAVFTPENESFSQIRGESIDYAVMENAGSVRTVPVTMGWSDVGTWPALHEARDKDAHGNSTHGRADLVDARNVTVETDGPRVSVCGVDDIVVVVDGDEVLVTSSRKVADIGHLPGATEQ